MRNRKLENWQGIEALCGRNADLEIGWRARKESYGSRFPDAELSFEMDIGEQMKLRWGISKRWASEWQSGIRKASVHGREAAAFRGTNLREGA
jgi:hypothetical protein